MSTITVICPSCSHQMQVPANLLGKKGKCPKCASVILITNAAPQQLPPTSPNPLGGVPAAPPTIPATTSNFTKPLAQMPDVASGMQPAAGGWGTPASPHSEVKSKKGGGSKKGMWIAISIGAVLLIAAGVTALMLMGGGEPAVETQSESKWEPSSVSTPKALIGQWYCSERDWTIFINSDGDYLLQYPNGGVSPWKLTVVTEIPRRSPEAAAFHISLHRKHIPAGKNIHKVEFSEDFKSFQLTFLGGSTQKPNAFVYVDSKERP